jgi:hypothetical protein
MRALSEQFAEKLVVVFGKHNSRSILSSYGFKNIMTGCEYHSQFPSKFPDIKLPPSPKVDAWHAPVGAVICIMVCCPSIMKFIALTKLAYLALLLSLLY